jgi:hypothetical protein
MCRSYYQRLVCVIVVALSFLFTSSHAVASAIPAYNGKMNNAVGSIIQNKIAKWGFAANDPRIPATMTGVGVALTTVAVGAATGAVATVGWPALLVAAGISAVVSGLIQLGQDAVTKWLFNSDGTVTVKAPGTVTNTGWNGSVQYGQSAWTTGYNDWGQTGWAVGMALIPQFAGCNEAGATCEVRMLSDSQIMIDRTTCNSNGCTKVPYAGAIGIYQATYTGPLCMGVVSAGTCLPNHETEVTEGPAVTVSAADVAAQIPESELSKQLSNETLAAAANAAWKAQSMSAGGLPWSASDPVTPADVATWRAENPSAVPTIGDVLAPVAPGSASSVSIGSGAFPSGSGSPAPAPGPAPTPGTGSQVDLGPNPNTPAPGLETIPTTGEILNPLLTLMPDLKNFAVPGHASTCPTPSFDALGNTYTISSHCNLIESNRAIIEAAMTLVFTIAATLIVLRA